MNNNTIQNSHLFLPKILSFTNYFWKLLCILNYPHSKIKSKNFNQEYKKFYQLNKIINNLGLYLSIDNLDILTDLVLEENSYSKIPTEMGTLINLEYITIYHGKIKKIPTEIGHLSNLIALDIEHNKISNIITEIGNLNNLIYLILTQNKIKIFITEIGNLINLKTLNLSYNKIEIIASIIGLLINLKKKFL
jgi:Leucine-rich repeat (LRR) protein